MDMSLGPNQGAGVPAPVDADSLQYNVILYNQSIPLNSTYTGTLPGWGTGELVAAITAVVVDTVITSAHDPSLPNDIIVNRTQTTLSASSLKDVTSSVDDSGKISVASSSEQGIGKLVFAVYQTHTEYREQESPEDLTQFSPQSPVTTYRTNGSWVVDHFSTAGANAVINFWEKYLLGGDTKDLIADVGNYVWEVWRLSLHAGM